MSIADLKTKVTDTDLASVLEFFKLPPGDDDDTVKTCILAARADVMAQVGEQIDDFYDENPIFIAAVKLDAYTMYNNRDKDSTAMIFEHPVFGKLINALKDEYRVTEETYGLDDDDDLNDEDDYDG